MLAEAEKQGITHWVEPFVGGANMIDKVPSTFKRIGYDINPHTIEALIAIRDLVDELPDSVSEAEYKALKGTPPNPITSWIRIAVSYGGIFESKLAADKTGARNYTQEAKRNARKQSPYLQGVRFSEMTYEDVGVSNALIYCDPPYQGTTSYKTAPFDHDNFFQWCRDMKVKGNVVFVSEYNAPDDFECVWQGEIKTNFASSRKKVTHTAVEKLFKV